MVSVIIPCRNAERTLGAQLEALSAQTYDGPWEVVIVDNGSSDRTREVAASYMNRFAALRVVDAPRQRSAAYARNVGVEAARGDVLLFCDADDEVGDNWLATMAEAVQRHEFVGCRLEVQKLNAPWLQQYRGELPQATGLDSVWYPPHLPFVGCGTMGMARRVHAAVGGFDASLPCVEDMDFCFRAQLAGFTLHFVRDAEVHYRLRSGWWHIFRQAKAYAAGNVLLYSRYRERGSRELWRWRNYVRTVRWVLLSAARMRTRADCARWVCQVGWYIGLLAGSLKWRVPPV
jgi:glycosyltransferase involved in cell wall biosynthesis